MSPEEEEGSAGQLQLEARDTMTGSSSSITTAAAAATSAAASGSSSSRAPDGQPQLQLDDLDAALREEEIALSKLNFSSDSSNALPASTSVSVSGSSVSPLLAASTSVSVSGSSVSPLLASGDIPQVEVGTPPQWVERAQLQLGFERSSSPLDDVDENYDAVAATAATSDDIIGNGNTNSITISNSGGGSSSPVRASEPTTTGHPPAVVSTAGGNTNNSAVSIAGVSSGAASPSSRRKLKLSAGMSSSSSSGSPEPSARRKLKLSGAPSSTRPASAAAAVAGMPNTTAHSSYAAAATALKAAAAARKKQHKTMAPLQPASVSPSSSATTSQVEVEAGSSTTEAPATPPASSNMPAADDAEAADSAAAATGTAASSPEPHLHLEHTASPQLGSQKRAAARGREWKPHAVVTTAVRAPPRTSTSNSTAAAAGGARTITTATTSGRKVSSNFNLRVSSAGRVRSGAATSAGGGGADDDDAEAAGQGEIRKRKPRPRDVIPKSAAASSASSAARGRRGRGAAAAVPAAAAVGASDADAADAGSPPSQVEVGGRSVRPGGQKQQLASSNLQKPSWNHMFTRQNSLSPSSPVALLPTSTSDAGSPDSSSRRKPPVPIFAGSTSTSPVRRSASTDSATPAVNFNLQHGASPKSATRFSATGSPRNARSSSSKQQQQRRRGGTAAAGWASASPRSRVHRADDELQLGSGGGWASRQHGPVFPPQVGAPTSSPPSSQLQLRPGAQLQSPHRQLHLRSGLQTPPPSGLSVLLGRRLKLGHAHTTPPTEVGAAVEQVTAAAAAVAVKATSTSPAVGSVGSLLQQWKAAQITAATAASRAGVSVLSSTGASGAQTSTSASASIRGRSGGGVVPIPLSARSSTSTSFMLGSPLPPPPSSTSTSSYATAVTPISTTAGSAASTAGGADAASTAVQSLARKLMERLGTTTTTTTTALLPPSPLLQLGSPPPPTRSEPQLQLDHAPQLQLGSDIVISSRAAAAALASHARAVSALDRADAALNEVEVARTTGATSTAVATPHRSREVEVGGGGLTQFSVTPQLSSSGDEFSSPSPRAARNVISNNGASADVEGISGPSGLETATRAGAPSPLDAAAAVGGQEVPLRGSADSGLEQSLKTFSVAVSTLAAALPPPATFISSPAAAAVSAAAQVEVAAPPPSAAAQVEVAVDDASESPLLSQVEVDGPSPFSPLPAGPPPLSDALADTLMALGVYHTCAAPLALHGVTQTEQLGLLTVSNLAAIGIGGEDAVLLANAREHVLRRHR